MRVWAVAVAIVGLLATNIAVVASGIVQGEVAAAPAYVPFDALGYVGVAIDPPLEQKRSLVQLRARLPDKAAAQLSNRIPKQLDKLLADVHLSYEEDVKPWLGSEVAGFAVATEDEPAFAVLFEATDGAAAQAAAQTALSEEFGAVKQANHRGVSYARSGEGAYRLLDDFLVIGHPAAVRGAIDASIDGGIDGNARYSSLTDALAHDRLATYWFDTPAVLEALGPAGENVRGQLAMFQSPPLFASDQPTAGALLVTGDSLVMETVTAKDTASPRAVPQDAALLGKLPADSWVAVVVPDVAVTIESALGVFTAYSAPTQGSRHEPDPLAEMDREFARETGLSLREDVLAWMRDGAFFVAGEPLEQLYGGAVITSDDPAATQRLADRLGELAAEQQAPVQPVEVNGLRGFTVQDPVSPGKATVLAGDRMTVTVGGPEADPAAVDAAAAGTGATLAGTAQFDQAADALGPGYAPVFYVDAPRALATVESLFDSIFPPGGSVTAETEADAMFAALSHVVVGTRDDGDRVMQRLVISAAVR